MYEGLPAKLCLGLSRPRVCLHHNIRVINGQVISLICSYTFMEADAFAKHEVSACWSCPLFAGDFFPFVSLFRCIASKCYEVFYYDTLIL